MFLSLENTFSYPSQHKKQKFHFILYVWFKKTFILKPTFLGSGFPAALGLGFNESHVRRNI